MTEEYLVKSADLKLPKVAMGLRSYDYDIELDPETKAIRRVYGSEQIAQNIKSRLLFVRNEWFLKLPQGIPYFDLLGRNPNMEEIRSYMTAEILKTWGVDELIYITLDLEKGSRKLVVTFKYKDIYGNIIREKV